MFSKNISVKDSNEAKGDGEFRNSPNVFIDCDGNSKRSSNIYVVF